MICPLCRHLEINPYSSDRNRHYLQCERCSLVFVSRNEVLPESLERKRYEAHENDETDEFYQQYLTKTVNSLLPFLKEKSSGLDFGCGRTNLLQKILEKRGYQCFSYDIFFHPKEEVFTTTYDFIILSEVIEHLRDPALELNRLSSLLNNNGILIIKTKILPEAKEDFTNWFYKRDQTHIQFFNLKSFEVMGRLCDLKMPEHIGEDLYLFRNNRSQMMS